MNFSTTTKPAEYVPWGDNEDGTFNNPILPADYSDPDAIRVDDDYFLITSTFQFVPGITVLHSKDMVNWQILGGAVKDITRIRSDYQWKKMPPSGYGRIIWAPCITYNRTNNRFYIHFATPDEGMFMVSATKDGIWQNEWSETEKVTYPDGSGLGAGWDDCGVLWDDDGKGYLVANNFKEGYKNYLFRLSEDGIQLLDNGVLIHESNDGLLTSVAESSPEAYKLFKKDGYYYFLHNAVVKKDGVRELFFLRAKNIYGDNADGTGGSFERPGSYEHSQKGVVIDGYNQWCQGNLLDTPDNDPKTKKWYFLTHQGSGSPGTGRPVCLIPVEWEAVGFPASKDRKDKWENIPKPFLQSEKTHPQTSDDFCSDTLSPQWMWNYQPRNDMWSLSENPGHLRLYAFRPICKNRLESAGNSLLQRTYAARFSTAETKINISAMTNGQNAGLQHCSSDLYGGIGVSIRDGIKYICVYGSDGFTDEITTLPTDATEVFLRSEWDADMHSVFSYSFDGITYLSANEYHLQWRKYRGDSIGFFNYNNAVESGYIDIEYFKYTILNK